MHSSESIQQIAVALIKAQAAIKPAAKDSVNPHFKSRYADLSAIWDACRSALSSNGLGVIQLPCQGEPGYAHLETVLLHESGEWISTLVSVRLTKDDAQGYGSALTYLRRYALAAMVGIVADEDDDGQAASATKKTAAYKAPSRERPNTNGNDSKLAEAKAELRRVLNHASVLGALSRESDLWPGAKSVESMSLGQVYDHTEAVIAFTEAWQQQQTTENTDQDNKTELFVAEAPL